MTDADALARLAELPRTRLASLPTRLTAAPNLARALGDPGRDLRVKVDAETGFALGGNKVRKLEFELAPERLRGVTCLITAGGAQSNHARVTAGAAARLGLECILVLNGEPPDPPVGNAVLHRLFGAHIRAVPDRADRVPAMEAAAREVEDRGGKALVVPIGASTPTGSLGYALAAVEMAGQIGPPDGHTTWVFTSASSCGTLAGLLLGFSLLDRGDVRLVGVSADATAEEITAESERLARGGAELLGWPGPLLIDRVEATDSFVGPGYGCSTPESTEAIALFGRTEGMVLDPVYTGKAAAGLIHRLRAGAIPPGDRVIFLHTGGHPALLV